MLFKTTVPLVLLTLLISGTGSEAATITVSSTLDVISDDGLCTLREAVIASNTDTPSGLLPGECVSGAGKDSIVLQSETYTLAIPGTGENEALTGDLDVLDSVEILGTGQTMTVIDGNDLDRVFEIDQYPNISVLIADLTIRDGATTSSGGGIYSDEVLELARVSLVSNSAGSSGGAVYGTSDLIVTDSFISENSAGSSGGGIYSTNLSSFVRSVVSTNSAGGAGGGLGNGGDMNITDSTIASNTANDGGGIHCGFSSTLTLDRSTISSNVASDDGGGIYGNESATIRNSTVSGNFAAGVGGGIRTSGPLDIRNSTVYGNNASGGSAIENRHSVFSGNVVIDGTCTGTDALLSLGGNIESPGDTCGLGELSDQVAVTPLDLNLGPLADNGGLTLTHAPILPSAAIDTAVNGICLPVDQRGFDRPQDGDGDSQADCDVGAVELDPERSLFCFTFDNFCDGIEITDVLPDKTVVATWQNTNCAGATAPMLGGYSGSNVSPRLSWLGSSPTPILGNLTFILHIEDKTFDLWLHDMAFNLTQIQSDQSYTVTPGACSLGPEKQGVPSSMDW